MSLRWREEFSVGNHTLDKEHQIIVELINEVDRIIADDPTNHFESLHEVISKLTYYITKHFYHEEHILRQANYPALQEHILLHTQFKRKLADLTILIMQNNIDSRFELLKFLQNWWSSHILVDDFKFKPFLGSAEIKIPNP